MDTKENFSYLDGVPFTIGSKFCPPQNVILPLAINYELSPELLAQKYDFDVENKVIKDALQKEEDKKAEANSISDDSENKINYSGVQKTLANHGSIPWSANSILQPLSQTQNKNSENASDVLQNTKKINLSDFENDTTSPFDYMELQTINDLEELNTVFQGLCEKKQEVATSSTNAECKDLSSSTNPHCVQSEHQESSVSKSISFPMQQNFNGPSIESNVNGPIEDRNSENYFSYSSPNTPGVLTDSTNLPLQEDYMKRNSFHGGEIKFSASALPPVPFNILNQNFGYGYSSGYSAENNILPLRSSKSIPDLTNFNPEETIHSKTSRSHTPPAKSSGYLRTENYKDSLEPENSSFNSVTNNSKSSNDVPSHQMPDPYEELKDSEKEIVDSIYDMGFNRGQVSRTVKHLGTDSKKVVEHLCQIQVLEESGYDNLEAEAALHLHDYNKNEAIKFLNLLNQFQDLGFEKNAIKKALVQNKNDRDKVIDALLSS